MFSLLLLPTLCMWSIGNSMEMQKIYGFKQLFLSDELFQNPHLFFSKEELNSFRNFTEYKFNNREQLNEITNCVKAISTTCDTVNGVHIEFGPGIKYADFIQVCSTCHADSLLVLLPYKNEAWIYKYIPRPVKQSEPVFAGPSCGGAYHEPGSNSMPLVNVENNNHFHLYLSLYTLFIWLIFFTFKPSKRHAQMFI